MGKESDLLHAVKSGEVSHIRKVLQKYRTGSRNKKGGSKKSNINQQDVDGFTLLHHAALVGNSEIVMALVEMEADPNARDKKGMTPLHMGSWAGKDQVVKALLENRSLVNLPSFSGETPLHLAAQHGYSSVVDYLLKYQADPTIRNNELETPLDLSCKFGHTAVVRFLLTKDEVVANLRSRNEDPRYKSPLLLASKSGHTDVVRLLVEAGADVNEESNQGTALHLAALYGKIEVVSLLLETGADVHVVNKSGMTPIDVVNQFTTSRAGIEIKQMLREAAGERVIYARAVMDYNNVYDPTSLSFKVGETITLIEQNENGRWKGSIIDGQEERIGFFPSTAVRIISKQQQQQLTHSTNSLSSSNSSLSTSSGKEQAPSKQSEKVQDLPSASPHSISKPVGVVPIGSYDVLTLSTTTDSVKNKKPPNLPRLNSFKKTSSPPRVRRLNSREDAAANHLPVTPSPHSYQMLQASPDANRTTTYDLLPTPKPAVGHVVSSEGSQESTDNRTTIYDAVPPPKPSGVHVLHNQPQGLAAQIAKQAAEQRQDKISDLPASTGFKAKPYADIVVSRKNEQVINDTVVSATSGTPSYTQVYVSDKASPQPVAKLNNTVNKIPQYNNYQNITDTSGETNIMSHDSTKKHQASSYEDMTLSHATDNQYKLASRTPEVKHMLKTIMRTGYEDMANNPETGHEDMTNNPRTGYEDTTNNTAVFDEDEFPQPPPSLPLKQSHVINQEIYSSPLRKIPGGMPRRPESYENVQPKQLVPIQTQIPFTLDFAGCNTSTAEKDEKPPTPPPPTYFDAPLKPREKTVKPSYENFRPPNPVGIGNMHSYENYKLPDSQMEQENTEPAQERKVLKSTADRPVPLPPKLLRRTSHEPPPSTPMSPSPVSITSMYFPGQETLENMSKDEHEVFSWLCDLKLPQYIESFVLNGFDMISIRGITPEDLTDIGVIKAGHRKKLLSEIAKLGTADRIPNHKPDDVVTWLKLLGLQQYEENFMEGGFDEIDFIKDLDKNDLEMIEIRKKGHQKKLLMAVQRLTDLDLTADLDLVVVASPSRLDVISPKNTFPMPPPPSPDMPSLPPPPSPSMLHRMQMDNNKNELDFPMVPPPPPIDEFDHKSLSHRDNLPPPPGAESTIPYKHQPLEPPSPGDFRHRSMTLPNAPKVKPKPKPVGMKGQVRTASEYHAKNSPPKAIVLPTPITQPKPIANGNQDTVDVTAARSRGFWQQQQPEKDESPPTTPKRSMTVSGNRPVTSPKPLPLTKPKPVKPTQEVPEIKSPQRSGKPAPPPPAPRKPSTLKKVPPPAPPRRDSKPTMDIQETVNNNNEIVDRSRLGSGQLEDKIKAVFKKSSNPGTNVPKPIPAQVIEESKFDDTPDKDLVDQLEETDILMADIDSMIADFSTQLDSMF